MAKKKTRPPNAAENQKRLETCLDLSEVCVVMIPAPPFCPGPRWTALQRKRRAIWRNQVRNRRVADLARAIHQGHAKVLAKHGIRLRTDQLQSIGNADILVESTEHGHELLGYLRDWQMYDLAPVEDPNPYGPEDDAPVPPCRIMTLAYAAQRMIETDVLICATGGRTSLARAGAQVQPYLVIDIADGGDAQAIRDAQWRFRDYWAQGWRVLDLRPCTRK
jgi:hypothetical protein